MNQAVRHLFVLNPRSFWHKWKLDNVLAKIHDFFKIAAPHNYDVYISRFPRDAAGFIPAYAEKFSQEITLRIYAVGGDGILFDCLNGIIGLENAELGAVPYGHANSFIRGFGKKAKVLFRDMERQFTAPVISLDAIHSGNSYALNFCSIGVTSLAILHTQNFQNRLERGGIFTQWLGRRVYRQLYFLAGLPAFFNRDVLNQHYGISIDGEHFEGRFRGMLMANGCYYGGDRRPAAAALPGDGLLDVVLARSASPLRFLSQLPFYMRGRQDKFPGDFILRRARKISIRSEEPILANFDDVVYYDTDFSVELIPAAIRFVDASRHGYKGALADE